MNQLLKQYEHVWLNNFYKKNIMITEQELKKLFPTIQKAWNKIMEIYNTNFDIEYKKDESPLTIADKTSNEIMCNWLEKHFPDINILSEENKQIPYSERKDRTTFRLLDPLDGTKEFIKKNWEFCISLGLIENNSPIAWVIYSPVTEDFRYAIKWQWTYKIDKNWIEKRLNWPQSQQDTIRVIASRSHPGPDMQDYINKLQEKYKNIEFVNKGSALKFCTIAEWLADCYPRLWPTMERDTAAWDIIVWEIGKKLKLINSDKYLSYWKENLVNPFFIVIHKFIFSKNLKYCIFIRFYNNLFCV